MSPAIGSCPVSSIALPHPSIASAWWAMQAVSLLLSSQSSLISTAHFTVYIKLLHPTPPLTLSSQKMTLRPVSEGMKWKLREGK